VEESRTSWKAYRAHVTRILNKVEATLDTEIDELVLTYLRTAITQLEKKKEQITTLDQRIIDLIQDSDDLETAILDAEELQDLIMEKINELNQRVEMLSRQTHVVSSLASDKATSEATNVNVSCISGTQAITTINSDIPAVSASTVTASDITTTSLTLESFTSTSLMAASHESVPSPISVTSTSYPSVTYVHSSGPPSLIPISTDSATLFPQFHTLNLGSSSSPSVARLNSTMSSLMIASTTGHCHSPQQFAATRLPKLTLLSFSGNPLDWLTFWDSFKAAIHLNPNLSGIQKFNYLKSQLQGDAARSIDGIPLSDQNYLHAVTLLQVHFGQTHRLVAAHMQAFIKAPNPANTLNSLRKFYDTVESHLRGLSSVGKSKQSYGDLLVPIILSKLPKDTIRNLARGSTSTDWKYPELISAIRREIEILDASATNSHGSPFTAAFMVSSKPPRNTKSHDKGQPTCVHCKGPHTANQCTATDHHRRLEIVKQNNLCFNCLGKHKVSSCSSKHRCRKCQHKHHSSLCTEATSKALRPLQLPRLPQLARPRLSQSPRKGPLVHQQLPHSTWQVVC